MTTAGFPMPANLPRRTLALALACLGVILWYDYPVLRLALGGFLLIYGALLFRWPLLWLAVLPACVPLLQLAHWSGRLFLEDFDIVLVFTLAVLVWQAPVKHRSARLPFAIQFGVFALTASYLVSLALGLMPWPDWQAPDFLASFLSPANAPRLAKGFFWALLISPFVFRAFREHPDTAVRMVVGGMIAGGLVTGAMALWERGVWHALLYGRDIYQLLGPLLDFSTPYRITGTFAEMHTGGEAIDGYLGLAWPILLLALALSRRPWVLALSSLALGLVIYSLVTTFSRGLYFSLAVAGGVWLIGLLRVLQANRNAGETIRIGPLLFLIVGATLLMGYGYSQGGTPSLASGLLMFYVAAWVAWRPVSRGVDAAVLFAALGLSLWAVVHGMTTSKWQPVELEGAVPLAMLLVGGVGVLGYGAGRMLPRGNGFKPYLVMAMVLGVGAGSLIPALMGYRMTERLSGVSMDFSTRTSHWRHVMSLKENDLLHQVFGMGLGSFPREYHWDNAHRPEGSGNFSLVREQSNTFVRTTGGKDLRLGQRTSVAAMEPVELRLRVRSPSPEARLKIRLCRRFVIHPSEWNSQCVTIDHTLVDTRGEWQDLSFKLDTGQVGNSEKLGRPPLMLEINNRREYRLMSQPPAVVDIDDVSLTDSRGRSYVGNGDFERGMDRWLPYYDFNHLPWHIKNLWLHLYFEQGAWGVLAFAASWLAALGLAWRSAAQGALFPVGVAGALTGFVAVGTFGSPIDAPRVAWLYFFLFFSLIAHFRATESIRTRDRLKRHSASSHSQTR